MNIAFIGSYSENGLNGVSVTGYLLAKSLTLQGHFVFFYQTDDKEDRERDANGITIQRFKRSNIFQLPQNMYHFLEKNPDAIDIFHIHSVFYPFNTLTCIALNKLKLPYVLSPHGGYNKNVFKHHSLRKFIYYHLFEKKMVHRSQAIFCVADKEVADLAKFDYRGRSFVVYNPMEAADIIESKKNKEQKKRDVIIFIGRYNIECKGLDILFHIFKLINNISDTIDLKLFGYGKEKSDLIALAQKLGLKNIYINSSISGIEKFEELQKATISIMPSRWEAFGTASMEAALMRIPVAVSKNYYMSDFIREHELGIILNDNVEVAAEQIIDFINNKDLLAHISSANRETVMTEFAPLNVALLAIEGYKFAISNFTKAAD